MHIQPYFVVGRIQTEVPNLLLAVSQGHSKQLKFTYIPCHMVTSRNIEFLAHQISLVL